MKNISIINKENIKQFININDLDYDIVDNELSKFSITASNGITFYFFEKENYFILSEYDKENIDPYKYYYFDSFSKLLESINYYENSIPKKYWEVTTNTAEIDFDKENYNEEWTYDFKKKNYRIESDNISSYIIYEDFDYELKLKSPYNTLHEVCPSLYKEEFNNVSKMYFEIHPISLKKEKEKYLFKLLMNEGNLKEFISWNIYKKKGLKLFIESLFIEVEKYKKLI